MEEKSLVKDDSIHGEAIQISGVPTRRQIKLIEKLGLQEIVPDDISPKEVNNFIFHLMLQGKISSNIFANYYCSRERRRVAREYEYLHPTIIYHNKI